MGRPIEAEGQPQSPDTETVIAAWRLSTPGYFGALGVPLLAGRDFSGWDSPEASKVVIVNQALARHFWGEESPVGNRLRFMGSDPEPWREIVGMVADVRHTGLEHEPRPGVYQPHAQEPWPIMSLVIRSGDNPAGLTTSVRAQIRELDPTLPLFNIRTMERAVSHSVSERRFSMLLLGLFAGCSLLLAGLGIFSVMSYAVRSRTREIGVHMALGAKPGDVLRRAICRALALIAPGIALGLLGALALTRLLAGLLFNLPPTDLTTYVVVTVFSTAVALTASYVPATHAARVDPVVALRWE